MHGCPLVLNDRHLLSEGSSGKLLLDPGLFGGVRRVDETISELEELFFLAVLRSEAGFDQQQAPGPVAICRRPNPLAPGEGIERGESPGRRAPVG